MVAQHKTEEEKGEQSPGKKLLQLKKLLEAAATEKVKGAEEAEATEKVKEAEEAIAAGEAAENKRETQKASEKEGNRATMSPIPQVDGIFDVKAEAEYEVMIDAHETCTSEDIIEAIHTNFIGALDEIKDFDNDHLRHIVIEQQTKPLGERKSENNFKNLQVFRVVVKKNDVLTNIIEGWNDGIFDDLAFRNAVYDTGIKIDVIEVLRLTR